MIFCVWCRFCFDKVVLVCLCSLFNCCIWLKVYSLCSVIIVSVINIVVKRVSVMLFKIGECVNNLFI